jgi:hypothetical protein
VISVISLDFDLFKKKKIEIEKKNEYINKPSVNLYADLDITKIEILTVDEKLLLFSLELWL